MKSETEKESLDLINSLNDPKIAEEVQASRLTNPAQDLSTDILGFFSERLVRIKKMQDIEDVTEQAILEKIQDGKDITFSQLTSFLTNQREQSTLATESILALLRPAQGSSNPLLSSFSKKADKNIGDDKPIDVETQRKVDLIFRAMQQYEDNQSKK
jgi:hypothetical protein